MLDNFYLEILFLVPSASISHYFPPPPTLMFLKENIKLDGIPSKIKCNMPVLHCISGFEGTSYKKLFDTTSRFVSCCFALAFIYIRSEFLQVFRTWLTIIGKTFLSQNLLF